MQNILRIGLVLILLSRAAYISYIAETPSFIFPETKSEVRGYIDDYKESRIGSNRYGIRVLEFDGYQITEEARLLVVTSPYTDTLSYGTEVTLVGIIENPKDFITDTGKTFDYDSYLLLSNVYGIMRDPDIDITGNGKGSRITHILFYIREKFSTVLGNLLPEESAILSKGVLLGEKSGITDTLRSNLAKTGTSHIIALSGYNITIISELVMQLTKSLPVILRTTFGAGSIILFVAMAGGGSSALRAMIMAFILLYARNRGKPYNALWALLISFTVLVTITPLSLRYDLGLHLSVLATFGLIVFQSPIAVFFAKRRFPGWLSDTLASTIAATLMTAPYIAYNMGIISVIGIVANVIVVPLLPALMLFSFLSGLIGQLSTILAIPFAFIAEHISSFIIGSINYFGELPFSAIYTEHTPILFVVGVYIVIIYISIKKLMRRE